jgi:iron complex outermembrane receptor protein
MFADLGYQNSTVDLHVNLSGADNFVGVTAAAPVQLLDLSWKRTFTSPQTTKNEMLMPAFNGTIRLNETTQFAGVALLPPLQTEPRRRQYHRSGGLRAR